VVVASDVVVAVVVVVDDVSAVVVSVVVSSCVVVSVVNDVDVVVADVDEVDVVVADVDIVVADTDVAEDSKASGVDVVQSLIVLTTWRRACSNELPLPSSIAQLSLAVDSTLQALALTRSATPAVMPGNMHINAIENDLIVPR
jgi:hypothetical protein